MEKANGAVAPEEVVAVQKQLDYAVGVQRAAAEAVVTQDDKMAREEKVQLVINGGNLEEQEEQGYLRNLFGAVF